MKYSTILLFTLLSLLFACKNSTSEDENDKLLSFSTDKNTEYAEKFSISRIGNYKLITVISPWQKARGSSFQYLLGSDNDAIPDSLRNIQFIQTPVKKVVIMSTTFVAFIDTLGELSSVKGVSGGKYICQPDLQKEIQSGNIRDIGFDQNINYEVIIDIKPDVLFMFGVQSGIVQTINKLKEAGVQTIICADYLEPHPLGRTEWIKFFSVFYEKEQLADSIFLGINDQYNAFVKSVPNKSPRPKVMLGLPWKDTWYVPGGNSYAAKLIDDAGGDYIYNDIKNTEAEPVAIESVFSRAIDADYWINPGVATNLEMILQHDTRFRKLNAFRNKNIYANSKRIGQGGGNDYWESGIIHPDLILHDLMLIFSGKPINNEELYYYFRLN